ncbi:hypothetical protein [Thalassotalea piscium]|uniref:Uncharacterized protein n=1 Tax=Thalassotalea piscium TaxID=1230533 RepID=A0A7X0NGP7_9GAMM|nr:hypothetical protein [Thalassotalea piscium]MBB6543129.1 hypothetical protein [Thalassotalea piscium]
MKKIIHDNLFYCDACEEHHRTTTYNQPVRVFIKDRPVYTCKRQYFYLQQDLNRADKNRNKAIKKLNKLQSSIKLVGKKGLKARIDFITIIFKYSLKNTIGNGSLLEGFKLSMQDYDRCFEIFDGDLVVHGLLKLACKNYLLKVNLQEQLGVQNFGQWRGIYNRIERVCQPYIRDPNTLDLFGDLS